VQHRLESASDPGQRDGRRGRGDRQARVHGAVGRHRACTGTLLNDEGTTHTPYIFSANHCFETAYEAATLSVWWFFDSQSCGSTTPANYVVQTGGAMLLGRSQDWDWALLRLNSGVPTGTSFRGWSANPVAVGSKVEIYHHPSGDLKMWSYGTTYAAQTVNFGTAAGGNGLFTRVVWEFGTTEGGSSGGAMRSTMRARPCRTCSCAAACSAATRCAATPTAATSSRSSARCCRWCAST
jgi:hypothetical protein